MKSVVPRCRGAPFWADLWELWRRRPSCTAQGAYPNKPVRYINPFPPAAPTDTLSRLFCAKMPELTGQQWIVENKGGSGGNVGVDALAKSRAGRLHAGPGRHRQPRHRADALRQAAVQPAHRLHLRLDDLAAAQHAGGQSRPAGQVGAPS